MPFVSLLAGTEDDVEDADEPEELPATKNIKKKRLVKDKYVIISSIKGSAVDSHGSKGYFVMVPYPGPIQFGFFKV